ncbi:MAG: flagellar hook-basal body complex protein [Oscillospiraceae bacterium]|nr:flagellar hook-basal body complex protein [Oscillospiraceae bacterium]
MVRSLFTGVTGLKSHQQRMDMIGNNIANVNTVGFKTDVMTFADVYYQTKRSPSAPTATLGGINPRQVGYGVKVSSVEANLSQSGYNYTDSKTDIALDGKGFFQVMDGAGNIYYTRAGHFSFDRDGYLVNADGYHVLGVSGECDGVAGSSDIIRAVIPKTDNHVSSATKLVNGTNVTVSVSAPSEYTDMSVAFKHADFPFATYANNILTVFINTEQQFDSQDAFDAEIQKALTAGGVMLPNDVELSLEFDTIPDDYLSAAAWNTVDELKFTTSEATCRFHISRPSSTGTGKDHAYIDFNVNDNSVTDNVKLTYGNAPTGVVKVTYDPTDGWDITIFEDTTAADINEALKQFLALDENSQVPKLNCVSVQIPNGFNSRADAIKALCGETPADTTINIDDVDAKGQKLFGVPQGITTGKFDFAVKEKGEFGNNYLIQFAKKSGYGSTTAAWEENTLTINICADTTIADVNAAIKKAANGDDKKLITFYDIAGLDYGEPKKVQELDGSVTWEYALGFSYNTDTKQWTNRNNQVVTQDDVDQAFGFAVTPPDADTTPADATVSKKDNTNADPDRVVWNVATRDKYFGGHPSVRPTKGKDSFYTKTAKSLSTFNLVDGRIGEDQSMDEFTDYMIGSDGVIIGLHPIYGTMVLGRVDIATFDNPNGLEKVGGTNFRETVASGPASVKRPGEDGAGAVVPNALEMSNVDLADEFTNMIATQRGYQANSRVVTVSDTMIEELLNLKR